MPGSACPGTRAPTPRRLDSAARHSRWPATVRPSSATLSLPGRRAAPAPRATSRSRSGQPFELETGAGDRKPGRLVIRDPDTGAEARRRRRFTDAGVAEILPGDARGRPASPWRGSLIANWRTTFHAERRDHRTDPRRSGRRAPAGRGHRGRCKARSSACEFDVPPPEADVASTRTSRAARRLALADRSSSHDEHEAAMTAASAIGFGARPHATSRRRRSHAATRTNAAVYTARTSVAWPPATNGPENEPGPLSETSSAETPSAETSE